MTKSSKMGDIFSLKGKVVLVTGSVGLVGAKICEGSCKYNAKLAMTDINKDSLSLLSKELSKDYSTEVLSFFMDIVDGNSVEDGRSKILDEFGSIDVLINNAYPYNKNYGRIYEDIDFKDWRENVDMHLNGYFNVTHKVSKIMMEQRRGRMNEREINKRDR